MIGIMVTGGDLCRTTTRPQDHNGPILRERVAGLWHFYCAHCLASISPPENWETDQSWRLRHRIGEST